VSELESDLASNAAAAMPKINPALVKFAIDQLAGNKIPVTLTPLEWAEITAILKSAGERAGMLADDESQAMAKRAMHMRDSIEQQATNGVMALGVRLVHGGAFSEVDIAELEAAMRDNQN
jgi:hypothetical protein